MKRLSVLFMTAVVGFCLYGSAVKALEVDDTPDSYWPQSSPLQISAFEFSSDGELGVMEVYNNSDQTIDISDWIFKGDFKVQSFDSKNKVIDDYMLSKVLEVTKNAEGKLRPRTHAVISGSIDVAGSSMTGNGWSSLELSPGISKSSVVVTVSVVPNNDTIKTDTYKVMADGIFYRRSKNTSSYGASFSPSDIKVYDDGLYKLPVSPNVEIIEIHAYGEDCAPESVDVLCGDFIKLHVTGPMDNLEDYVIRTDSSSTSRVTSNTFSLANAEKNGNFLTIRFDDSGKLVNLTNSGGYVWIEDLYEGYRYGSSVGYDSFTSDKKDWSYIKNDDNNWVWTTSARPGQENLWTLPEEKQTVCPAGKYLNPETGRCRTIEEAVNALAACPEGQERNPVTNRCRKIVSTATATLEPCKEGYERNPLTNRCRSIASAVAELIPCDEGYERNPQTNRCRKSTNLLASTAKNDTLNSGVTKTDDGQWGMWTWALVSVGATGAIGYGVYEWRSEIGQFGRKIAGRFGKK